jgi:anti-sigma B factor antagonist
MTVSPLRNDGQAQAIGAVADGATIRRDDNSGRVSITQHAAADISVVRVVGDIDLDAVCTLRAALEAAVVAHAWVIVDLSRAGTVDSVGLSVLVTASLSARRANGDLLLVTPSRFLSSVLRSARLATAIAVYDTLPQAISAAHR